MKYADMIVWQKAMKLVNGIYKLTGSFPSDELSGLTTQLRRASVSIPSNIAEGKARNTRKEYARFIAIALGSAFEVECQLLLAETLSFGNAHQRLTLIQDIQEIIRMLRTLKNRLSDL